MNESAPEHGKLFSIDKDGVLRLHFHLGQSKVWRSTARYVAMIAGTQSGKTSFGSWWLHREIQVNGGGDYLAVTATYDLFKLKMLPEMLEVFCDVLKIGRYWRGSQIIELRDPETNEFWATAADDKMWGRIILRAASSPGGLESATAKAAWLDECGQDRFDLDAYEAVLRRLSLHRGRVLMTTTPYNLGWLKQQIYDHRFEDDIDVFQFSSTVNPLFSQEEYDERQRKMQDWRFHMMYDAIFSKPAGLIYNCFIDADITQGGHKVKRFEIPKSWPRYVGIDPGGANTAKLYLALNPKTDVYYVYRESLTGDLSVKEHAQEILNHAGDGERFVGVYIGQKAEKQYRIDYALAGISAIVPPFVFGVEEGIDRVVSLFKEHRLIIFNDLRGILDEIGTYTRKLDENGEVTDVIENKNRFHRLDALRYAGSGIQAQGVLLA